MVSTWIHIRRGHRNSGQRPSRSMGYLPSLGRARWVGGRRWSLSRRRQSPRKVSFYYPFVSFLWRKHYFFLRVWFLMFLYCWSMHVAKREPTPCYRDAYSVDTPRWALWEKGWLNHCKTTFSPLFGYFSWSAKGLFFFLERF